MAMTLDDILKRTRPTANGCLEWTGKRNSKGYGHIRVDRQHVVGAHRIAWALSTGREIPPGMFICHHCDNPPCVNPDHLYLGDRAANALDAVRRGGYANRRRLGENHHSARLTDEQVRQMRDRHSAGESMRSLARSFGITHRAVSCIVQRRWRVDA